MAKATEIDAALDKRIQHAPRMTEHKLNYVMADKGGANQYRVVEALVFRAELEILIGEYRKHEIAYAVNSQRGIEARYVGEFLEQNHDLVCKEIQKRLSLPLGLIEDYLAHFTSIMRSQLAEDECINPYTGESSGFSASQFLPPKKVDAPLPEPKPKKSKKKKGKRREALGFESIAEANRKTGLGRRFIQYHLDKADSV